MGCEPIGGTSFCCGKKPEDPKKEDPPKDPSKDDPKQDPPKDDPKDPNKPADPNAPPKDDPKPNDPSNPPNDPSSPGGGGDDTCPDGIPAIAGNHRAKNAMCMTICLPRMRRERTVHF